MTSSICSKQYLRAALLASAVCAPPALMANEISGTLDGEEHTWQIISEGNETSAYFSELVPGMMNVTIQGHRSDTYETQGTLSISFGVMNGEAMDGASVMYLPEKSLTPHYGTEEDIPFTLESLELGEERGRTVGRVTAELPYLISMAEGYDHSRTMEIDISFDVELQREDF